MLGLFFHVVAQTAVVLCTFVNVVLHILRDVLSYPIEYSMEMWQALFVVVRSVRLGLV